MLAKSSISPRCKYQLLLWVSLPDITMYSSQIICRISHITNFVVLISFSSLQNERHLLPLWIRLQFQKNRRAITKMFLLECRISPSVLVSLPYGKRDVSRKSALPWTEHWTLSYSSVSVLNKMNAICFLCEFVYNFKRTEEQWRKCF